MSDKDETTMEPAGTESSSTSAPEAMDELTLLKQRADILGIAYHPNIGVEKLRAKVQEKLDSTPQPQATVPNLHPEELESIEAYEAIADETTFTPGQRETAGQIKMKRRQQALKLVRVRVVNMNPLKAGIPGDIFSVGNSEIGFVKKFVPYNCDAGYHVPQIILDYMREKKFMSHYEVKVGNKKIKRNKLVPELAIEIMPPLTDEELMELKQRQLMASGQVTDKR